MGDSMPGLQKQVEKELRMDRRIDCRDIRVHTEDGQICISGRVPTYTALKAAELDVEALSGSRNIDNELVVDADAFTTDDLPDEYVRQNADDAMQVSVGDEWYTISTEYADGCLTLTGAVDSLLVKRRIYQLCRELPGIKGVLNKVAVTPTQGQGDIRLAGLIIESLCRIPGLDINAINVEVVQSNASLSGAVPDPGLHLEILSRAQAVLGVLSVYDGFTVTRYP